MGKHKQGLYSAVIVWTAHGITHPNSSQLPQAQQTQRVRAGVCGCVRVCVCVRLVRVFVYVCLCVLSSFLLSENTHTHAP